MIARRLFFCVVLLTLVLPAFCQTELHPVWDNGLKFESKDGATSIGIGGRLHYDLHFRSQAKALDSIAGPTPDNVEIRRARLSFTGTINNTVAYEFAFSLGKKISYADMYVAFLKLPVVEQLTVGHFREPFGLEENTSSSSIVFMERSLTSTFGPGRNTGIMVQKPLVKKHLRLYAGVFRLTNSLGVDQDSGGKHSYAARLAYYNDWEGAPNKVLHLGLSTNLYAPPESTYSLKAENETHADVTYLRSGKIHDVKHIQNLGGEAGYSYRNLTLQTEYVHSFVRIKPNTATALLDALRNFNAYYATASFFVGGERKYSHGKNRFSKISLNKKQKKAWEVALRYSKIFLKESLEKIKRMNDVTVGLNWYYNEKSRLMLNYIHTLVQRRYHANTVQMRLQVTF